MKTEVGKGAFPAFILSENGKLLHSIISFLNSSDSLENDSLQ